MTHARPSPRNRFLEQLQAYQRQIGLWLALADSYTAEILAGIGYDWLLIDAEHAPNDIRSVLRQLQAIDSAASGLPAGRPTSQAVVRLPSADPVTVKRYLEIGAENILVPMVESAREAAAVVAATRYPPEGIRGMGSGLGRSSRWRRYEDYVAVAGSRIGVIVQVESVAAVENVAAIAATPGVDAVLVGPSDLAASMGHPGRPGHPDVVAASCEAISQARAAGRPAGVMGPQAHLPEWLAAGASFFAVTSDVGLLTGAAGELLRDLAALPSVGGPGGGAVQD
ncbi:HpcH/HpaI aldolase/citrate lyase family protein [Streptomyces sp. NPDC058221]|uniref:HpcH/HpaI aldolase family protein n=1 Tax=Streptomyces sp. NPDC058221 TaxID=3346388 RepID=UPI0036EAAA10